MSSTFFYPNFQSKAGCSYRVHNAINCFRAQDLDSSEFSITLLKLDCHFVNRFIRAVYRSPNSNNYAEAFKYFYLKYFYLKVELNLPYSPLAGIHILENFIVRWLCSFTDQSFEEALIFAPLNDLEEFVRHLFRILDCSWGTPKKVDLFLTSNPAALSVSLCYQWSSSNNISVSCSIAFAQLKEPAIKQCF